MGKRTFVTIQKGITCQRTRKGGKITVKFTGSGSSKRYPSMRQILRECNIRTY